jgi:hypothetical protein
VGYYFKSNQPVDIEVFSGPFNRFYLEMYSVDEFISNLSQSSIDEKEMILDVASSMNPEQNL